MAYYSNLKIRGKTGRRRGYKIYFYYGYKVVYVSEYVRDVNYEINRVNALKDWTCCFVYDREFLNTGNDNRNSLQTIYNSKYSFVWLSFFKIGENQRKYGDKHTFVASVPIVPEPLIDEYLSGYLTSSWDYVNVYNSDESGYKGSYLRRIYRR